MRANKAGTASHENTHERMFTNYALPAILDNFPRNRQGFRPIRHRGRMTYTQYGDLLPACTAAGRKNGFDCPRLRPKLRREFYPAFRLWPAPELAPTLLLKFSARFACFGVASVHFGSAPQCRWEGA